MSGYRFKGYDPDQLLFAITATGLEYVVATTTGSLHGWCAVSRPHTKKQKRIQLS
jgi:hypothetical protein